MHFTQLCFNLPCGQGVHSAHLDFSFPCGQGVHFTQYCFSFPWGQGLHSAYALFAFLCAHRFSTMTHHLSFLGVNQRRGSMPTRAVVVRPQILVSCFMDTWRNRNRLVQRHSTARDALLKKSFTKRFPWNLSLHGQTVVSARGYWVGGAMACTVSVCPCWRPPRVAVGLCPSKRFKLKGNGERFSASKIASSRKGSEKQSACVSVSRGVGPRDVAKRASSRVSQRWRVVPNAVVGSCVASGGLGGFEVRRRTQVARRNNNRESVKRKTRRFFSTSFNRKSRRVERDTTRNAFTDKETPQAQNTTSAGRQTLRTFPSTFGGFVQSVGIGLTVAFGGLVFAISFATLVRVGHFPNPDTLFAHTRTVYCPYLTAHRPDRVHYCSNTYGSNCLRLFAHTVHPYVAQHMN